MKAAEYDIYVEQGSTFNLSVALKNADESPVNLTGYTGSGSIKNLATDSTVIATFDITIPNPTDGIINISISAEDTAAITTDGKTAYNKYRTCYYDIDITKGDIVNRILNGKALISPEITKSA